jgi:hypothetical protein
MCAVAGRVTGAPLCFAEFPALRQRRHWSALKSGVRACTLNVGRLRTALVAPWRSPFTGR